MYIQVYCPKPQRCLSRKDFSWCFSLTRTCVEALGKKLLQKYAILKTCSKSQFIGITWSVVITCQWGKRVFYIKFLLHFTPLPQLRKVSQMVYAILPPTTEEAQAAMPETEVKTSPNTCQACLLFRCHCQALQSDGHVPQALLKCCHQVSLKVKPYRRGLSSPPKQEYFCRYLNGPPSARHCLLCKWYGGK